MGVPPFVAVAVNVTLVPEQMFVPVDATILTLAVNGGPTVIVIIFDVAGLPVKHGLAFDVIIHKI